MRMSALLFAMASLSAAEHLPAQVAAVEAITSQVRSSEVVWSDAGTVIKLAISNHSGTPKGKAGRADAPGVTPAIFARIVELTDLEAIAIESQPLGDDSYRLLAGLKKLRDVRLQYLDGKVAKATCDAPLFINDLPLPLKVLEIKHCFSISGGCMARFKLQPELEKLEIDTGWATPEAIPFILAAKRLRNLQIHRTTLGDADLAVLAAGLPELETLLLRPNGRKDDGRLTYASLKHLRALPKLRHLILGLTWGELTFVGGLDGLVGVAGLRQLDLNPGDSKGFSLDDPAVQALHQARPDILIRGGGKTLGGATDQVREDEDAAWNWDKGVNTHG